MYKKRRNVANFSIKYTLSMSLKSFLMNLNFPKIILCFGIICILPTKTWCLFTNVCRSYCFHSVGTLSDTYYFYCAGGRSLEEDVPPERPYLQLEINLWSVIWPKVYKRCNSYFDLFYNDFFRFRVSTLLLRSLKIIVAKFCACIFFPFIKQVFL